MLLFYQHVVLLPPIKLMCKSICKYQYKCIIQIYHKIHIINLQLTTKIGRGRFVEKSRRVIIEALLVVGLIGIIVLWSVIGSRIIYLLYDVILFYISNN